MATVRSDLEIKADARSVKDLGRALRDAFKAGGTAARDMKRQVGTNEKALERMRRELGKANKELDKLEKGTSEFKKLSKEIEGSEKALKRYERQLRRVNSAGGPKGPSGGGGRAAFVGGAAGAMAVGAMGGGAGRALNAARGASSAIPTGSPSQPYAAAGQIAGGLGGAMGNIPLVGWAAQMFNQYVSAGMQIAQGRMDAYHGFAQSMTPSQFGLDLTRKRNGKVRGQEFNKYLLRLRRGTRRSFGGFGSAHMSPAQAAAAMRAAGSGPFAMGDHAVMHAGQLTMRGFDARSLFGTSQSIHNIGGMTSGSRTKGGMGRPGDNWEITRDLTNALISAVIQTTGEEGDAFFGKGKTRNRNSPKQAQRLLEDIAKYGEMTARQGLSWSPIKMLGLVRALRSDAISRFSSPNRLSMTPEQFSGVRSMDFMNKMTSESKSKGSALNFFTFLSAMQNGVGLGDPSLGRGKGPLFALRAARLGVGQGAGRVTFAELMESVQGMFGRGDVNSPGLADFLLSGDHRFAEAMTRLNPLNPNLGGLSAIKNYPGGTFSPHFDGYHAGQEYAKMGYRKHTLTGWEKKMNTQKWRDINKGQSLAGSDFATKLLKQLNEFQDKLVKFAQKNWSVVIKQMDVLNSMTKGILGGIGGLLDGLAAIVNVFSADAAKPIRALAKQMQLLGKTIPVFK